MENTTADTDFGFDTSKIKPSITRGEHPPVEQPPTHVFMEPPAQTVTLQPEVVADHFPEYFAEELLQGTIALVEEFSVYPFAGLGSDSPQNPKRKYSVGFFGFPFEIPGEFEMERRVGIELAPEKVYSALKSSGLRAVLDQNAKYYEFLSNLPPAGAIILEDESTVARYFSKNLSPFDLVIGLGGGNHLLNTFFAHIDSMPTRKLDYLIKISPKTSRKPIKVQSSKSQSGHVELDLHGRPVNQTIHNNNYFSAIHSSARNRVIHFGVLDSEASQAEIDLIVNEDKSSVVFLDKSNQRNLDSFSQLITQLKSKKSSEQASEISLPRVGLLIDCESIQSTWLPGVSNPAIFGLTHSEIKGILASCVSQTSGIKLSTVLFTNFNPAIETDRTSRFLAVLIHSLLQNLKDSLIQTPEHPTAN